MTITELYLNAIKLTKRSRKPANQVSIDIKQQFLQRLKNKWEFYWYIEAHRTNYLLQMINRDIMHKET
jgi:hypothetical protein